MDEETGGLRRGGGGGQREARPAAHTPCEARAHTHTHTERRACLHQEKLCSELKLVCVNYSDNEFA